MVFLGVAFICIGVLGEAVSGTWFEQFFNPAYPQNAPRWDDERIKIRLGRLTLCLGVVLLVLGGLRELLA